MPRRYLDVITLLVSEACELLDKGEALAPIAFVGNCTTGATVPVVIQSATNNQKDRVADTIRLFAAQMNANFVLVLVEAYSLR